MRLLRLAFIALALGATAVSAQGECASYETRYNLWGFLVVDGDTPASVNQKFDLLETGAPGYCPLTATCSLATFSNGGNCGGPTNSIGFRFRVAFNTSVPIDLAIRHGPDYGLGGFLRLDDTVDIRADDLWWNGNIEDSSEVLSVRNTDLQPGSHVIESVGFEGCCDGTHLMQLSVNGGPWMSWSCKALEQLGAGIVAPSFVSDTPAVLSTTLTSAVISVATSEPSTAYCKLFPASMGLSSACQVYLEHRPRGTIAASFATGPAGAQYTFDNLECGSSYMLFCGAVSESGAFVLEPEIQESGEIVQLVTDGCNRAPCNGPCSNSVSASSSGFEVRLDFANQGPFNVGAC